MNNNRNQKVNQVKESTLVVGIDIAKKTHYACAVDDRGRELCKSFPVKQANNGFENFLLQLHKMMERHQRQEILIGFEPTGHYWMNLAAFLTQNDIRFVMVNPMNVKRSKELDDNLPTKNDQKDARVIAKLMTNGYFSFPRILKGVEAELRQGSTLRWNIKKDIAKLKNRMNRWLDRYFPEFPGIIKGFGENACAVLKQTPLPVDLIDQNTEDLVELYRNRENLLYPSRPKIAKLQKAASYSIGLTEGATMARMEIIMLVEQYCLLQRQLEEINEQLTTLAKELPEYEYLISIPGIGKETVTQLLAETGSLRQYINPRQLIKLAGLTLRDNSSGQMEGRKRISKRGRKKLRALLYRAVLPLMRNNEVFAELYQYYITRRVNPLRKKEALLVLCNKLLKVLHGLAKHQVSFNGTRMRQDLTCLQEAC